TFITGDLQIPPAQIVYTDSAGQADTISASAINIAVESLHPGMDGDIRDIKPPVSLPGDRIWIYWLAAGLILAAAGTALFLLLRKRKCAAICGPLNIRARHGRPMRSPWRSWNVSPP
ncbi:hypothetical protein KAU04_03575, partial [bacterium]|nr:hypothetical protein [bacterium]